MTTTDGHNHNDGCLHCGLDYTFDMPPELLRAARARNLVVFAGAGVSTEVPAVFPTTFYDKIRASLGLQDQELSFPAVMQAYEESHSRTALVQELKARFDYVNSFYSLRYSATRFHQELATMPYVVDIITTNWDTYFEEECLATPFVTGADFAFHALPGRRVYKIHGSMSSVSSLVVTEDDYGRRLEELRDNALGGSLRHLLSTKTVVFIGYSLRDWNFRRLYQALRSDMGAFAPRAYLVNPFASDQAEEADFDIRAIKTSGTHFLRELKNAMVGYDYLADEAYDDVAEVRLLALEAKDIAASVSHVSYPAVLHCWSYQEGLIDACGRIAARRGSGEYSDRHHVQHLLHSYMALEDRALARHRYFEAAYIDGYVNGLLLLLNRCEDAHSTDEELPSMLATIPYYFVYGSDRAMRSEADLQAALADSRRRAPKARAEARRLLEGIPDGMIISHGPFLDLHAHHEDH